jgi:hypothetical protein
MVRTLLDLAKQRMGEDGDSNDAYGKSLPYFNAQGAYGLTNPPLRALIEKVGENAKLLMNRRGVGVRYFTDYFGPKLPSSKVTKNAGNGPTAFHQDFITLGLDRTGGMTFWTALEDYGAESGTMSFISRSHRMGVFGAYDVGDLRDAWPELRDQATTEPIRYEAGDVTVHSFLTAHGAGANLTDRPRWAYLILTQPSDARWIGARSEVFDTTTMELNQTLPNDRFPIIA